MPTNQKSKVLSVIMLAVISILLFALGFYSFAWLTDVFSSGNIGFNAGELDGCELHIAKITTPTDSETEIDESDREYTLCENMQIEYESLPQQNGDSYTISLEQMTLGFIDNVALLKPDNVVYFRLSVPKKNGSCVNMKLYYDVDENGNFINIYKSIYDTDGETVLGQEQVSTSDTLPDSETKIIEAFEGVEAAEVANDCFLKYSVLLSNENYDASELSELQFYGKNGEIANEQSDTYYRFNEFNDASECVELVNENIGDAEEFYYVYVRVEPNLNVFGYSIEYISSIMPCYVYFHVKAHFEIFAGGQG